MTTIKIIAALFIVAALVSLFAIDNIKVSAVLLILGSLINLLDRKKNL